MTRWMVLSLLFIAGVVAAQSDGGYENLHYRDNDPFVLCTQGQKIPDKCWVPLPPYTGAYTLTGLCNPPNQYGRSWKAADNDALEQYLLVCPMARQSGSWEGGQPPEQTPFTH